MDRVELAVFESRKRREGLSSYDSFQEAELVNFNSVRSNTHTTILFSMTEKGLVCPNT